MALTPELGFIFMLVIIAGIGTLLQHPSYEGIPKRTGAMLALFSALGLIANTIYIFV